MAVTDSVPFTIAVEVSLVRVSTFPRKFLIVTKPLREGARSAICLINLAPVERAVTAVTQETSETSLVKSSMTDFELPGTKNR